MSHSCGSCGSELAVRVTSMGATLCWPCVRDTVAWLHRNDCLDNPFGLELVRMAGQRVDTWQHHGFMIWAAPTSSGYPWIYVDDSRMIY